jgi:hypothetical protein
MDKRVRKDTGSYYSVISLTNPVNFFSSGFLLLSIFVA